VHTPADAGSDLFAAGRRNGTLGDRYAAESRFSERISRYGIHDRTEAPILADSNNVRPGREQRQIQAFQSPAGSPHKRLGNMVFIASSMG